MGSGPWEPLNLDGGVDEPWVGNADPAMALLSILEGYERPAWHARAACRGKDPALFFPARGQDTRPAKALCHSCPVQVECLTAGFSESHGIWGGSSERGRRRLRKSTAVDTAA